MSNKKLKMAQIVVCLISEYLNFKVLFGNLQIIYNIFLGAARLNYKNFTDSLKLVWTKTLCRKPLRDYIHFLIAIKLIQMPSEFFKQFLL